MPVKAYLGGTMLARLLACLALVTGLAAIGVPVQASVGSVASEQASPVAACQQVAKPDRCQCQADPRGKLDRNDAATACRTRKPVVIYIPTVQLGADRARE